MTPSEQYGYGSAMPEKPAIQHPDIKVKVTQPDTLWSLVRDGTFKLRSSMESSSIRDGSVVIGPDLGGIGNAPRLLVWQNTMMVRIEILNNGSRSGFYDPVPEDVLSQYVKRVDEGLTVNGTSVFRKKGDERARVAYWKGEGGFYYQPEETVNDATEFASHLKIAGSLFGAFATAYYANANIPTPSDTVFFRPDELLRAEEFAKSEDAFRARRDVRVNEGVVVMHRPLETFEDIGGQEPAVTLCRRLAHQLRYPEVFALEGSPPPRGILLYGPQGTGKTLLGKAVAQEANAHFILVTAPDIVGYGLHGQSEHATEAIFTKAAELTARDGRHVIIFLDEAELLLPSKINTGMASRDEATGNVVGIFAQRIDGFKTLESDRKATVMLVCNEPGELDPRILSRMDEMVEVPLPDAAGLSDILRIHLSKLSQRSSCVDPSSIDINTIAEKSFSQSFSGRDMADVISITARQRGQKQLEVIMDAVTSGKLIPEGADDADFINRIAAEMVNGRYPDFRLSGLSTDEILQTVIHAKALLRDKRRSIGFGR